MTKDEILQRLRAKNAAHRAQQAKASVTLKVAPRSEPQGYESPGLTNDLRRMQEHVENRFAMCNVVAKRALELGEGAPSLCAPERFNALKPVSTAMAELEEGKLHIRR